MSCIDGHKFCVQFDYEKHRFHTCPKSSNRLLICRPDGEIATVSPQGPRLPPCLAKIATPILPPRDCHSKIATQDCQSTIGTVSTRGPGATAGRVQAVALGQDWAKTAQRRLDSRAAGTCPGSKSGPLLELTIKGHKIFFP